MSDLTRLADLLTAEIWRIADLDVDIDPELVPFDDVDDVDDALEEVAQW